jgi:HlyD family secretion protein
MTRTKKKSRKLLYFIILLVIIGSAFAYRMSTKKEKVLEVAVATTQKRTIVETVAATGKLFPATELEITSNVSGTLISLLVKEGDLVKKGELLARIDADALQSIVERSQASTQGSRAQLEAAKAQKKQLEAQFANTQIIYTRNQQLYQDGIIPKIEFEAAEATYNTALANIEAAEQNIRAAEFAVKSAEATVKEQKNNLSQTRIYAPINGVVSTLYKKQGEQVVGTAQMAGTPILKIANLKSVEIRVDVNERDILNTSIGDTADIELDAYPDRKFLGMVTQIANTATGLNSVTSQLTSDQVTNFEVKILMLEESYADLTAKAGGDQLQRSPFRAGLSASADIKTNTKNNVLSVPAAAVTAREKEATKGLKDKKQLFQCVFVQQGDSVLLREVETGIQNFDFIEVTKGLSDGENVIKAPFDAISKTLKDSMKIKVVEEADLYKKEEKK